MSTKARGVCTIGGRAHFENTYIYIQWGIGSTKCITTKLSLYFVHHLCIVLRVATMDLFLINEYKNQWGMHDRKKSAFREYIYPSGVPEIPMAHQNRAKLNPIVKTVKNC